MIDEKLLSEFLPSEPKKGCLGFFPCSDTQEWGRLPLPMRCITFFAKVKYVAFEAWFDNYKIKAFVNVNPENVHKVLFCLSQDKTQLYTVKAVIYEDGTTAYAKWVQDMKTGSFAIVDGSGSILAKQGGYECFIPPICYKNEDNDWKLGFNANKEYLSYVSF